MRLIDADAEILKIEAEIERIKERIKKWEENRADRSSYDVEEKIKDLHRNISEAKIEIRTLKHYATAYDGDEVVEQLNDRSVLARPAGWIRSYELLTLDDVIEIVKGGGE